MAGLFRRGARWASRKGIPDLVILLVPGIILALIAAAANAAMLLV